MDEHYYDDKNFCEVCGASLPAPDDKKGQEDWFDVLMDHFVYGACTGKRADIEKFLLETDPDGDLLKAYNQGHW